MDYYRLLGIAILAVVAVLAFYFLLWFATTKLCKRMAKLVIRLFHYILMIMGLTAGKYQDYIDMMNAYRRERSLVYKYHYIMNVAIESLGLRTKTNVQSVSFYIVLVSFVIASILTTGINSFVTVFLFLTLVVFFHLLLVFLSRSRTIKRSVALMDAEDILCTSMEDGIQVAVDKNINAIDPLVRYMFEEFQTDIALKTPIGTALDSLNTKAGKQFDAFCQTALNHYKDNDPVSLMTFADNIQRNSKRRIAIAQQQINYKNCMKFYAISIVAVAAFTAVMIGILGSGLVYFSTPHGRTFTVLSVCVSLLGFIASQIIFSGGVE